MRSIVLAIVLFLSGGQFAAAAAVPANTTNMSFDPGHGTQIEYVGANGATFLWYPGNRVVLPGHWKSQGGSAKQPAQICFIYGANTYNPVTRVVGAQWECEPTSLYTSLQVERAAGDVFGLAHRSSVPFVLSRDKTTIADLESRLGIKASATTVKAAPVQAGPSLASAPSAAGQCAAIVAAAQTSKSAMIDAGLAYYHGMWMGQHCLNVDYSKAFALLRQAGDTADLGSLTRDLKLRAAAGNPKAVAALEKMGL